MLLHRLFEEGLQHESAFPRPPLDFRRNPVGDGAHRRIQVRHARPNRVGVDHDFAELAMDDLLAEHRLVDGDVVV